MSEKQLVLEKQKKRLSMIITLKHDTLNAYKIKDIAAEIQKWVIKHPDTEINHIFIRPFDKFLRPFDEFLYDYSIDIYWIEKVKDKLPRRW